MNMNTNPTVVIQQFTGIANMNTKDTKLKLTPSEDLLLSNAFYKYQVEVDDNGLRITKVFVSGTGNDDNLHSGRGRRI